MESVELRKGYTADIESCLSYLSRPDKKAIYNPPFEVVCWLWFLAYVMNFRDRHNTESYKLIDKKTIPIKCKKDLYNFYATIHKYCVKIFTNESFSLQYSERKGFHIVTKTKNWLKLITSLVGDCYSLPMVVMEELDRLGLCYFHDNGILVGAIAMVNHECDCDISYGFDWQKSVVKKSKISANPLSTIVPIFLSWDKGKLFPRRQPPLDIGSEVVVKYFDVDDGFSHINESVWFHGQCNCIVCNRAIDVLTEITEDPMDPLFNRAIGILDPEEQSKIAFDVTDYGYDTSDSRPCLAKSKPRKFKAFKSTKAFYSQVPKILYSERFLELKMKRRQLAEINMGGLDKRFSVEFLRIIQSFQGTS
jgi:hypothetical protein